MEDLIPILEQSVPFIIIVGLAVFMTLETWMPYFEHGKDRKRQKWHNLGNLALSFVLNALLSGMVSYCITESTHRQFGLLFHLHLPASATLVTGILLSDLNGYVAHRLYHRIPLFWRFHRVHHSDIELDATSALRLHPFEFIFQAATQAIVLPLLGVSGASFVLYVILSLPLFILNHANLKYPLWYEKYASLLFVTPNWHRVHHSSHQPETDSNFGDVFTLWDRLFRTSKRKSPEEVSFGLETLRDRKDQSFLGLLKTPFVKLP